MSPRAPVTSQRPPAGLSVTWLGNQACILRSSEHQIFIDPWIEGNPGCPITLADVTEADAVVVTHGHPGHFGDSTYVAARTGGSYVATETLTSFVRSARLLPASQLIPCTPGEANKVLGATVTFYVLRHPRVMATSFAPWRPNCGIVWKTPDITIFHAGDISTDREFKRIGAESTIDYALLPLTGHEPAQAAAWMIEAARALRPKVVIPTSRIPAQRESRLEVEKIISERPVPFDLIWPTAGSAIALDLIATDR